MNLTIRPEKQLDIPAIRRVNREAFPGPEEAGLVDLLRERGKALVSLVAENEEGVIGHILFSPVALEPILPGLFGLGLAPLAVLPGWQGHGVGSRLVRAGLEACLRLSADFVVVLGEPDYYSRFGFQRASRFGLRNVYAVDEPFMALPLCPGVFPEGLDVLALYSTEFKVFSKQDDSGQVLPGG